MNLRLRQIEAPDDFLARAAGLFAAVAEDGEDQSIDKGAGGNARVGKIMQRGGAFRIEELQFDVEIEFFRPGVKNRNMLGLLHKNDGVSLETERRFHA